MYCQQSSQFLPIFTELEDLSSTFIANCVSNIFHIYTAFMLNILTFYAIHKTSTMPKTLKTLLLSLACSDVAVGLFSQPLYTFFLINWLRLRNPDYNTQQVRTIFSSTFSAASFLVVTVSVDRFLACCSLGDQHMAVQYICYFDEIVGAFKCSGSYKCNYGCFRFYHHPCGVHQDIFNYTTAQE